MRLRANQRILVLAVVLMNLICLYEQDILVAQQSSTLERTAITERLDTLLLRSYASLWRFSLNAGAGTGWSLGEITMPASINNPKVQAIFTNTNFAAVQSWNLGVGASFALENDAMRINAGLGMAHQAADLRSTPTNPLEYSSLESTLLFDAFRINLASEIPHLLVPALSAQVGIGIMWSINATAQTRYIRPNTVSTVVPPIAVSTLAPAVSIHAGLTYSLRNQEQRLGNFYVRGNLQPSLSIEWQPLLSATAITQWGALILRLGCAWNIEPFRSDTLSVQPFQRIIPLALLPETPLANLLREEEGVAGRVVSPQELNEAVLEDRVIIYRPADVALVHGIPAEALEILSKAVQYIRSGARCRIVLTVPTQKSQSVAQQLVQQAEYSLRIIGDYLLKKGVEESSIEAGLAENIYNAGEAWQLRIRIARAVR